MSLTKYTALAVGWCSGFVGAFALVYAIDGGDWTWALISSWCLLFTAVMGLRSVEVKRG